MEKKLHIGEHRNINEVYGRGTCVAMDREDWKREGREVKENRYNKNCKYLFFIGQLKKCRNADLV